MTGKSLFPSFLKFRPLIVLSALCLIPTITVTGQTKITGSETLKDKNGGPTPTIQSQQGEQPAKTPSSSISEGDRMFDDIYSRFYDTYRLGSADEIAVRVQGQPEHSIERTKVSPVGTIYHNLLGEVRVAGLTIKQLTEHLTVELGEYLVGPKVIVELIDARSAKIGVLGDVLTPGIIVMTGPMKVLDVITQAGGFALTGSKSNVTVLRQINHGNSQTMLVNVKRLLEGKAAPEENIPMQPGDLVVVHGNTFKTIGKITTLAGLGSFVSFISTAQGLGR
jgi:protein involved in polysaccharide export with SLBB domain